MDQENFVEWDQSPFSQRAQNAALKGHLNCAAPLLGSLEKIHAISRGLEKIFQIAKANRVQEMAWADKDDDDESMQSPMRPNTIESLLALGEAVSGMVVADIERVSTWLDQYGVKEPDPVADFATAVQMAVAEGRRGHTTAPETEAEAA